MRKIYFILAAFLVVAGCKTVNKNTTAEQSEPQVVKSTIARSSMLVERDFAGLATPMEEVNMAFKISGQVLELPVVKGEGVKKNEVLASLDTKDVDLQLEANRSSYEQALSRLERAKRLLEHSAVSQQEYESAESLFTRAKSSYENSEENLRQTKLRAPFDAVVERVDVEAYERVQAGETILRIVSPTTRQVEFTVPESSLAAVLDTSTRYKVRFDNIPDVLFEAEMEEYARTTSDASGFPASLLVENPKNYYITPGMSCTITMISREGESKVIELPLSAIYAPVGGGTYVWTIDAKGRAERKAVSVEKPMSEDSVLVTSGIDVGERIITAGVYQLTEGERVKTIK